MEVLKIVKNILGLEYSGKFYLILADTLENKCFSIFL